jgi:hypothetical protein
MPYTEWDNGFKRGVYVGGIFAAIVSAVTISALYWFFR